MKVKYKGEIVEAVQNERGVWVYKNMVVSMDGKKLTQFFEKVEEDAKKA